jgi:ketosteroid isomerase-like protein
MKTFSLALIALFSLPGFVSAQEKSQENGLRAEAEQAVRENERRFFELGQEKGTRAAFLQFLADDSIIFHPGPVSGKQEWTKRPEKGISLEWRPVFIWVARSLDLAYSTGPAEWRKEKEDEKPFGYGQFLTIWKKPKDGDWKVALDVGGEVPGKPQTDDQGTPNVYPADDSPLPDRAAAAKKLQQAENKFAAAAKADSTIALSEAGLPDVRVHREGVFPAVGKYPAQLMLSVQRGKLSLERLGGGMSEASDLAYSYGKYSLTKPMNPERGYYLQIWRTDSEGAWKIALDYQSPLPAEKK